MASSGNTLDLPGDAMHLTGHTYDVNKICVLPGGDKIATASDDESVGIFSLSSGTRLQLLRGHGGWFGSVEAIDADTIASVGYDMKVRVWRASDGTLLDETSIGKQLWSIALLARNRLLIGDSSGGLHVTEWSGTTLTKLLTVCGAHSYRIRRIAVHGDRSATASYSFFSSPRDKTAKVWDTRSFECVATLQGHTNLVLCVAMNDEHIVTGSLDKTLQVYSASSFAFQRAIAAHENCVYEVQFVQGGVAVLSGSDDTTIALHSVRSGECHWRMRVGMRIKCFSVLPDGRVAAAGGKPYDVVVFSTPSSKTWQQVTVMQPSKIVTALAYALTNPTALDDDYLRKYIRPEHVTTPEELLAGHNLMLLAVRLGVITRHNLRNFGGSSWHLKDSLYLPATKMHTDNPAHINAIFQHAGDVGLITEAYALKIAHEIRSDIRAEANAIIQAFCTLSQRVTALEFEVTTLKSRFNFLQDRVGTVEKNVDTLHQALTQVRMNQVTLQQGVQSLSQNLTDLKEALQRQDRLRKYAGVAKTLISFIPFLGSALGNAAYFGTEIILGMTAEDLVSSGVDITKSAVDNMAAVDLSSFQVVSYMFSEAAIAKLEAPARKAITEAVTNSDFKNLATLRISLREQISAGGRDDPSVAFLDIGSSLWLSETEREEGSSAGSQDVLAKQARRKFEYLQSVGSNGIVSFRKARKGLGQVLKDCNLLKEIPADRIRNLFKTHAGERDDHVSEELFLTVFEEIRKEQEKITRFDAVVERSLERFGERAGSYDCLEIWEAERVVRNVFEEFQTDGIVEVEEALSEGKIEQSLTKFDKSRDREVDRKDFQDAINDLLGNGSE